MARDILLDTSPIIAHLRGKIDITDLAPPDSLLFVSIFSIGELAKGANKANDPSRERAKVEAFIDSVSVISPDTATAVTYGRIAADLERRGQKIPENDVWIAAVALECGMDLATADAHFDRVRELRVLKWSC